jgi:hypothetical protein
MAGTTAIAASMSSQATGSAGSPPGTVTETIVQRGMRMSVQRFVEANVGMTFKREEVSDRLFAQDWPAEYPFPPAAFSRQDESDDQDFYSAPRFVYHVRRSAPQLARDARNAMRAARAAGCGNAGGGLSFRPRGRAPVRLYSLEAQLSRCPSDAR